MNLLRILAGVALLGLGRKLYWLFVAAIGFVFALTLSNSLMPDAAVWLRLLVGLLAGLVGAWLAGAVQRLAITLAGAAGGAVLLPDLLALAGMEGSVPTWVLGIVGAVVGAVLIAALFDWALILISSLLGAVIVARVLPLEQPLALLLVVVVTAAGILTQVRLWRSE